jgi:hypothetical protein
MRKKLVLASQLSDHPTRRILLSRETVRTLISKELSQAAAGNLECPCGSDTSSGGTKLR